MEELVKRLRELASIPEHCENVADCGKCTKEEICLSFTNKRIIEVATQAADAIEALADRNVGKWIPVTERLPEKMQYVLVRYQNNDMAVASWFGGDEHIRFWRAMTDEGWCADCDTEPTHWMPLPEPPKEE